MLKLDIYELPSESNPRLPAAPDVRSFYSFQTHFICHHFHQQEYLSLYSLLENLVNKEREKLGFIVTPKSSVCVCGGNPSMSFFVSLSMYFFKGLSTTTLIHLLKVLNFPNVLFFEIHRKFSLRWQKEMKNARRYTF